MSEELIKRLQERLTMLPKDCIESRLFNEAIAALSQQAEPVAEVHVILDGPPSHESGRFVECEDADGKSINVGRWEQRGKYWHLIINTAPQSGVREGMLRAAFIVKNRHDQAAAFGAKDVAAVCAADYTAITRAADHVNTDTVSVPREPTKQMLDAGGNAHWGADLNGNMLRTEAAHRIYNAMLRAAQEGKK